MSLTCDSISQALSQLWMVAQNSTAIGPVLKMTPQLLEGIQVPIVTPFLIQNSPGFFRITSVLCGVGTVGALRKFDLKKAGENAMLAVACAIAAEAISCATNHQF